MLDSMSGAVRPTPALTPDIMLPQPAMRAHSFLCAFQSAAWHSLPQYAITLHCVQRLSGALSLTVPHLLHLWLSRRSTSATYSCIAWCALCGVVPGMARMVPSRSVSSGSPTATSAASRLGPPCPLPSAVASSSMSMAVSPLPTAGCSCCIIITWLLSWPLISTDTMMPSLSGCSMMCQGACACSRLNMGTSSGSTPWQHVSSICDALADSIGRVSLRSALITISSTAGPPSSSWGGSMHAMRVFLPPPASRALAHSCLLYSEGRRCMALSTRSASAWLAWNDIISGARNAAKSVLAVNQA
mmetsp:Transcript_29857/g.76004  ORF Transcript_29857/g.76004 Transcript_29857/m.76004 type:complete len:301 (-) Transcript_29857:143-1045(-)